MVEHLWKSLKLAQKQDSKASAKTRLSKNNPHMHRVLLSSEHKGKREETNLRREERWKTSKETAQPGNKA
jgi:hypothetical protein